MSEEGAHLLRPDTPYDPRGVRTLNHLFPSLFHNARSLTSIYICDLELRVRPNSIRMFLRTTSLPAMTTAKGLTRVGDSSQTKASACLTWQIATRVRLDA